MNPSRGFWLTEKLKLAAISEDTTLPVLDELGSGGIRVPLFGNRDFSLDKTPKNSVIWGVMVNGEKKDLTPEERSSIILTYDEARIITNLRRYAKMFPFADLAILIKVHDGLIKNGLLCLGEGADSNIKL